MLLQAKFAEFTSLLKIEGLGEVRPRPLDLAVLQLDYIADIHAVAVVFEDNLGVVLDIIVVHEIGYGVDVLTLKKLLAIALQGVAVFLLAHELSSAVS